MTHQIDILGRPPIMKAVTPKPPEIRPALRCEDKDGRAVVYVPYATGTSKVDGAAPVTMPATPWGGEK
ncbi:hypothetical protein ACSSNL_13460 [Thalassobius sp. S69A]|uniref:hypothetical protein n=1 Tax=unclassified Thalassovita TaxID=2619711 RepID=UPI003C7B5BC7